MNINKKSAVALLVGTALLAASALASAQEQEQKKGKKAWEIGAGVSGMNYVRTTVYDFEQLSNGEYRFKLEDKHLYGGPNLYVARELAPWLYLDVQGTFGIAKHRTDSGDKTGYSILVGPGLQLRPFDESDWIVPYARVGINHFWKNFDAVYLGKFKNDPTGQARWEAEDEWNKSLKEDKDSYVPITAGLGVIGWVSNRIGIGLQADYNYDLGGKGKNFAQGTATDSAAGTSVALVRKSTMQAFRRKYSLSRRSSKSLWKSRRSWKRIFLQRNFLPKSCRT